MTVAPLNVRGATVSSFAAIFFTEWCSDLVRKQEPQDSQPEAPVAWSELPNCRKVHR